MFGKKKAARKEPAGAEPVAPLAPTPPPVAEAKPTAPKEETPPTAAAAPDAKPASIKSAAARMLTRSLVVKKPEAARGDAQRVADATKPSQKPQAGGGRRGPRRGASKGR